MTSGAACFKLPGAPKIASLANSLPPRPTLDPRPSRCVRYTTWPMSHGRPDAHPGRTPSPTPDQFAPPHPKKTSLSRATRSRPCPIQPHTRPTPSTRLRHFSPPIRPNSGPRFSPPLLKYTHNCTILATRGTDPAAGNPASRRSLAPGIRRRVPCGRPVAVKPRLSDPAPSPCPPLSRGVTLVSQKRRAGITDSHRTGDTLS